MANQEETQRPSHFIKAILSLENARMKIPARFVKEHGKTLSKDVSLEVGPSESTWKLGVERCEDGLVWLREGWKAFAEYYSIKFAHILMFRYKGKSKFHVSIFDPSLMEIQYPVEASSKSGVGFDQSKVVETEEDETDDEDEGEEGEEGEGEEGEEEEEDMDDDADYDDNKEEEEECRKRLQKYNEKSHAKQSSKKRTRRASSAQDKVLERAETYKSPHPSFSVKMLPKSLLCVPHTHSIRHFLGKENKGVYLKVGENEKTWFVKYCIGPQPYYQVRFLKFRWTKFMKDNHLEDGDICVFELIDSTKMVYKVTIFRIADYEEDDDNDDDDECSPVRQSKEKRIQYPISARNRVLQRAQSHSFKCQNPCFHIVMTQYHLRTTNSRLYIPMPHAKDYLLVKGEGKICLTNGRDQRTWYAPYAIEAPMMRVRLKTVGWRPFKEDNHLQVGDVCVFVLVDSSRMEYNVAIFHVADYA